MQHCSYIIYLGLRLGLRLGLQIRQNSTTIIGKKKKSKTIKGI